MKFYVTTNDEDYIKFNEYYLLHSNQGKSLLWTMRLMLPVFALVAIVFMGLGNVERSLLIVECAVLVILSVVWQFQAKKIMLKSVRKGVENTKKDGKLPYPPQSELEFTENEVIETTENSVQKARYAEIRLVGETEEHIFLLLGALQGIVIPKSCTEGRADELIQFLKGKIPS